MQDRMYLLVVIGFGEREYMRLTGVSRVSLERMCLQ